jgi:hypothetical protein
MTDAQYTLVGLVGVAVIVVILSVIFTALKRAVMGPSFERVQRQPVRQLNHDIPRGEAIHDPHCPAAVCTPSRQTISRNNFNYGAEGSYAAQHQIEYLAQIEQSANLHLEPIGMNDRDSDGTLNFTRDAESAAISIGLGAEYRASLAAGQAKGELPAGDDYVDTTFRYSGDRQEIDR